MDLIRALRTPGLSCPLGSCATALAMSSPRQVAAQHRAYRYRVLMGSGYRADLWSALEGDPFLTASDLARQTYASFATAWQVKRDFATLAA